MKISAVILTISSVIGALTCASKQPEEAYPIPKACQTDCKSEYGSILGTSPAGVEAYSNCNANCVIFEPNHYKQIYTGIKWQCVEYARRWLLHELNVVYGDVDIAADIWALDQVSDPTTKKTYAFNSIVNGAANIPQKGDLLIYSKEFLGTGHVAVVTLLNEEMKLVKVAEQNYANASWQAEHSREIKYVINDEQVWLLDPYLIGWKRVEK